MPATFARLREALDGAQRPLFYLAIPPSLFGPVVEFLGSSGCAAGARVVVEKPFGRDLASAKALNRDAAQGVRRRARSSASTISSARSRCRTCCTSASRIPSSSRSGIATTSRACRSRWRRRSALEGRGKFYEEVGAIRDVVQNHLLEVVASLAMDPPVGYWGEAQRDERIKVLRAISPFTGTSLVRGQFRGYREEPGVAPDSEVETYAAMQLHLNSWRWQGVPFFIRAGKCLPVTATEVMVILKAPPQQVFDEPVPPQSNYFRFRLGPDEVAIAVGARTKSPGERMAGEEVELYVCNASRRGARGLRAAHRRRDDRRRDAVRARGQCRGGVGHCRRDHPSWRGGVPLRARDLGAARGGPHGGAPRRLVQPAGLRQRPAGLSAMQLVVAPTPEQAAALAARHVAGALRRAVTTRAIATVALSGGSSPIPFLTELARQPLPWESVHVYQVDERVAPRGDPARNLTALEAALCGEGPLPPAHLHALPVDSPDLQAAAGAYGRELEERAGLDVVHLGLGTDGHIASLFPGDPALETAARSVAVVGPHAGYRRLTLTLPVINAARDVVWFVTGAAKRAVLAALVAGDARLPASRVATDRAHVFADKAAAPAG